MDRLQVRTQKSDAIQYPDPGFSVMRKGIGHLLGVLMHVNLHLHVEFIGVHEYFLETLSAHGVGRMRADGDIDAVMMTIRIVQAQALVQAVFDAVTPDVLELDHREADLSTHPRCVSNVGALLWKEVHIGKGGCAGRQHFRDGDLGAKAHKIRIDVACLQRPDRVAQPCLQRLVLSGASQEGHGSMAMCVDQAREHDVLIEVEVIVSVVLAGNLMAWSRRNNATIGDCERLALEHDVLGRDGEQPTRFDQQITGVHSMSIAPIIPDPKAQMM